MCISLFSSFLLSRIFLSATIVGDAGIRRKGGFFSFPVQGVFSSMETKEFFCTRAPSFYMVGAKNDRRSREVCPYVCEQQGKRSGYHRQAYRPHYQYKGRDLCPSVRRVPHLFETRGSPISSKRCLSRFKRALLRHGKEGTRK